MNSFQATRLRRCLLAAAVAQILISLPVVGQTASDARNQTEKGQTDAKKPVTLQTVVVTAQRRTQDIQKVPIAVTALNEAELNVRGITNVLDLSAVAPSLVVVPTPGTNTGASGLPFLPMNQTGVTDLEHANPNIKRIADPFG